MALSVAWWWNTDYFGLVVTVRIELGAYSAPDGGSSGNGHRYPGGGEVITIKHWNPSITKPGT